MIKSKKSVLTSIIFAPMKTDIGKNISQAKHFLDKGEVIAVPTETVYGLAANALIENAVEQIFKIKQRPFNNPIILHFHNTNKMNGYIQNFPETLETLAKVFWPGPLTILLEKTNLVSEKITAGNSRVAVRIPDNTSLLNLLKNLDYPLAAPSANPYGKISPTCAQHVFDYFKNKIPYILDGGKCQKGIESTILGLENNKVIIYRYGSISPESIGEVIGYLPQIKNENNLRPEASGMVLHHYAPDTPCSIFDPKKDIENNPEHAYILFQQYMNFDPKMNNVAMLSSLQNEEEAAANLYEMMHFFDQKNYSKIFIELLPNSGIGLAINDKIKRASAKYKA